MAVHASDLSLIDVGGPCKITDGSAVIYTEGDVMLEPQPTWRAIPSSLGGEHDSVLTDLVWKISFTPKPVWNTAMRAALLPTTYYNWTAAGGRLVGASNRSVVILGADGVNYTFTRAKVTKMPSIYCGLGKSVYDSVEYTGFLGTGKLLTATDAFFAKGTDTWAQTDYPTTHQEALCSAAWGTSLTAPGWDVLFAEEGFTISHDLKLEPVKQGNVTVDYRIAGYRAGVTFKPQGPTVDQLLARTMPVDGSFGIGTRLSATNRALDFVISGPGIGVTAHEVAVSKMGLHFDNKTNRQGELTLITAMTAPGDRLTLADS